MERVTVVNVFLYFQLNLYVKRLVCFTEFCVNYLKMHFLVFIKICRFLIISINYRFS